GFAGQRVIGTIAVRVGGGDVDLEVAQTIAVEVERAVGLGGGMNDGAVFGNGDEDRADARAGIGDVPGEKLMLPIGFIADGAAELHRRAGCVVVGDGDAAKGVGGQRIIGAIAVGVGGGDIDRVSAQAQAVEVEGARRIG